MPKDITKIATKQPTTTSFSGDFLAQIKQSLLKEKEQLERDLAKFAKKNSKTTEEDFDSTFPDYGDKEDENAAEVADYAANLSIEQDFEKILRDVDTALDRLSKGTYGICKYCKKRIQEKRLLARPTSSACVECKKAIIQEV